MVCMAWMSYPGKPADKAFIMIMLIVGRTGLNTVAKYAMIPPGITAQHAEFMVDPNLCRLDFIIPCKNRSNAVIR